VRTWKKKEADAVAEVSRRAALQQRLRETVEALQARSRESQKSFAHANDLQKRLDALQEKLRNIEFDRDRQLRTHEQELTKVRRDAMRAASRSVSPVHNEVTDAKLSEQALRIVELEEALSVREKDVEEQKTVLEEKDSTMAALKDLLERSTEMNDTKQRERLASMGEDDRERAKYDVTELKGRIEILEAQLATSKAELSVAKSQIESQAKEIDDLKSRNAQLEEEQKGSFLTNDLELEIKLLRSQLSKAQNSELRAVTRAQKAEASYQSLMAESKEVPGQREDVAAKLLEEREKSKDLELRLELQHAKLEEVEKDLEEERKNLEEIRSECFEIWEQCSAQARQAEYFRKELKEMKASQERSAHAEEKLREEAFALQKEAKRIANATRAMLNSQKLEAAKAVARKEVVTRRPQLKLEKEKTKEEELIDEEEQGDGVSEISMRPRRDSAADKFAEIDAENLGASTPPRPSAKPQRNKGVKREVICSGFLLKAPTKTKPYWARWKKRLFVLDQANFYYFRTPNDKFPRRIVAVDDLQLVGPQNTMDDRANKFYVRTPNRTFELCAPSRENMQQWMNALSGVLPSSPKRAIRDRLSSQGENVNFESFYNVLGVSRKASTETIQAAYESLAAEFHPDSDTNPDPVEFEKLNKAFNVLSTPSLRMNYDASLDVQTLFSRGFVASLHPDHSSTIGVSKMKRPKPRRFFCDEDFTTIMWSLPSAQVSEFTAKDFTSDDVTKGIVALEELEVIRGGEDIIEGPILKLSVERSACIVSLLTRQGASVNIEVDSQVERDKILYGLRLAIQQLQDP